jgi:hypothetical protein
MSKPPPFKPAKHKWLAEIICIESPACARRAVKELSFHWDRYKGLVPDEVLRSYRRLLIKAASEAIRRCRAHLAKTGKAGKTKLSSKERREFKTIIKIYQGWLKKHRLRR